MSHSPLVGLVVRQGMRELVEHLQDNLESMRAAVDRAFPRYRWRVRTRLPERFGHPCRVLVSGRMNSILVQFEDGSKVVTSRWNVRRMTEVQR